jgi:5-methylcytosine-specific restriction endonuclease McrA
MISQLVQQRIREEAVHRCGYCLFPQKYLPWILEIEHIIPKSKGGSDEEDNLWLACHACNLYKGVQTEGYDPVSGEMVPLFNPRRQSWSSHFKWENEGEIITGRTATGRATVLALRLNNLLRVTVRRNWIKAGWTPPSS